MVENPEFGVGVVSPHAKIEPSNTNFAFSTLCPCRVENAESVLDCVRSIHLCIWGDTDSAFSTMPLIFW